MHSVIVSKFIRKECLGEEYFEVWVNAKLECRKNGLVNDLCVTNPNTMKSCMFRVSPIHHSVFIGLRSLTQIACDGWCVASLQYEMPPMALMVEE